MIARRSLGPRVAIVSDTVDDENGVALGLRRLVTTARRAGYEAHLVGAARAGVVDDVVRIPSAMTACLPFYPDMTWSVPELPPLTTWLSTHADLVQVATPGPLGIAGLMAARMLGLPVIAQYHTEVAEFAARMTGMPMARAIIEPIVAWFYKQADLCLAPSDAVARRLASFGIGDERVWRVQRGVDRELFHPRHRDRSALARFGITDEPVALYVGRLSKEKNLDVLTAAWASVVAARPRARLLVVGGEGPLRGTFRAPGMIETGGLYDAELATVFASADVFMFPSETETFGNVVIEAAASGLPAIVAPEGAAHEHVIDGVTGFVLGGAHSAQLARKTIELLDDDTLRARMRAAAREHTATYDLQNAVHSTWRIYERLIAQRTAVEAAS